MIHRKSFEPNAWNWAPPRFSTNSMVLTKPLSFSEGFCQARTCKPGKRVFHATNNRRGNVVMRVDDDLIQRIGKSEMFSEYQAAFEDATGLPLSIRPTEFWNLPHRNRRKENPFCAMMAQSNRTCVACLEVQQRAVEAAKDWSATVTCFAGLSDTAVPVKLGERRIGFLQTGQVALKQPTRAGFKSISAKIMEWGPKIDLTQLEEAYLNSKVLTQRQHAAVIRLLEIFGQQLSAAANRMTLQDAQAEPPMIRRAKAYIAGHYGDPVGLEEMARTMHVSTFYFCKMFKKS